MYTLRNVGNAANRAGSNFSADLTLIRKLYTVNRVDDVLYSSKEDDKLQRTNNVLIDYMQTRTSFYYTYKRELCRKFCKCCAAGKATPADRIFDKGKERLMFEMDILRILRVLRECQFFMHLNMK